MPKAMFDRDLQRNAANFAALSPIGFLDRTGHVTMKGYLKQPAAKSAAFAGGWFHTGDLAVMHSDGCVKIKDRSKDIIISGGEYLASLEIEDVMYRHPAVAAVGVVAVPDARWGGVPCVYVELREGVRVDVESLIAFYRSHLAGFKVPKRIVFESLPKTATGKIRSTRYVGVHTRPRPSIN